MNKVYCCCLCWNIWEIWIFSPVLPSLTSNWQLKNKDWVLFPLVFMPKLGIANVSLSRSRSRVVTKKTPKDKQNWYAWRICNLHNTHKSLSMQFCCWDYIFVIMYQQIVSFYLLFKNNFGCIMRAHRHACTHTHTHTHTHTNIYYTVN